LNLQNAAYAACGSLAFIAPESAIPLLVNEVGRVLNPSVYNWITTTDIKIWKAPEGILVVNGASLITTSNIKFSKSLRMDCQTALEIPRRRGIGKRNYVPKWRKRKVVELS
jgi:hypothetical protein